RRLIVAGGQRRERGGHLSLHVLRFDVADNHQKQPRGLHHLLVVPPDVVQRQALDRRDGAARIVLVRMSGIGDRGPQNSQRRIRIVLVVTQVRKPPLLHQRKILWREAWVQRAIHENLPRAVE